MSMKPKRDPWDQRPTLCTPGLGAGVLRYVLILWERVDGQDMGKALEVRSVDFEYRVAVDKAIAWAFENRDHPVQLAEWTTLGHLRTRDIFEKPSKAAVVCRHDSEFSDTCDYCIYCKPVDFAAKQMANTIRQGKGKG